MATGTMKWFGLAPKTLLAKEVDFLDDEIKGMLTTVTYVPDQDAHDYKDDVTNEVTGTGYTAGGQALANKTVTYTAGTNVGKIDADDLVWSNSTIVDARVLVNYDDTPATDTVKPLLFYSVFDANVRTDAGAFPLLPPGELALCRRLVTRFEGRAFTQEALSATSKMSRAFADQSQPLERDPAPWPMMRWSSNSISSNCLAATTPPPAPHRSPRESDHRTDGYGRRRGRWPAGALFHGTPQACDGNVRHASECDRARAQDGQREGRPSFSNPSARQMRRSHDQ
jgi:hypothetical protein